MFLSGLYYWIKYGIFISMCKIVREEKTELFCLNSKDNASKK